MAIQHGDVPGREVLRRQDGPQQRRGPDHRRNLCRHVTMTDKRAKRDKSAYGLQEIAYERDRREREIEASENLLDRLKRHHEEVPKVGNDAPAGSPGAKK